MNEVGFQIPNTKLFVEIDFHQAWQDALYYILNNGESIVFGSRKEKKPALNACLIFDLTGQAIKQILDKEVHAKFPFQLVKQYCNEFTPEFLAEHAQKPEKEKFAYLYFERLAQYAGYFGQLSLLKDRLAEQISSGISSNRDLVITWQPDTDLGSASPPCLQGIQVRHLGNREVVIYLTWRSRDIFGAWQVNIVAIIDMLKREVLSPNNCKIAKIVDISTSGHIYGFNVKEAITAVGYRPAPSVFDIL